MKQHDHDHDEFGGLARDVKTMSRRRMFGMFAKAAAGLALAPIVIPACSDASGSGGPDAGGDTGTDGTGGACPTTIPSETAGPYPGDGTNGPNALTLAGFDRADIRTSVGTASGTAAGVAFGVTITLVDATTCAPLVGYAIYIWHCNATGNYSMYTGDAVNENYLRGIQVTDANGQVTFTTVFPACYAGRWPHIHFEMYASLADETTGTKKQAVSQLALPKAICDQVFADTAAYPSSAQNLSQVTLASDMVFSDGATRQIPTITGTVAANLASSLTVAI
jgi:protocatechuate 3,4-dioxygenase beta subunit